MNLRDQHGRSKRKLRISVTDRCNFRCPYCMPETPEWLPREELLSFEEIQRLASVFVSQLGIEHIRLTGGEPLLRKDLPSLINNLQALRKQGLERVSLTTNGVLLPRQAAALKTAGLDDLNISLDTLDTQRFSQLSGGRGELQQVLDGIQAAREQELPVKINCVVMRDINEADVLPLLDWAISESLPLRFIEFMPLDSGQAWNQDRVVREEQILSLLRSQYAVTAEPASSDPANRYILDGHYQLGIIPTISNPFCKRCDRLRLTATGELYACLFSANGRDLRSPLRAGSSDSELMDIIRGHVWHKEAGYALKPGYVERPITMHALGG
ncbi:MAG: GTP 3',8-cyclase MoaA [Nevskiales bacterium]